MIQRLCCELHIAGNATDVTLVLGKSAFNALCAEYDTPVTEELNIAPGYAPSFIVHVRRT
jgi:hypothetical protein